MTGVCAKTRSGVSYILRRGPGPALVFLHGIGSNARSFQPLFDLLPAHFHLLAWNAPGYLNSDPSENPWPLAADYARSLAGFLDDLAISKVHLVGHSLGTLIAAAFARHFPDRLHSLTLVSAANGYGVAQDGDMPAKVAARIADLNTLGPVAFATSRAASLIHEPNDNKTAVAAVATTMAEVNPKGYAQAVRLLASGDLPADLVHVNARPNFVVALKDRVTPPEHAYAAAAAWERAHAGQAHVVTIEQAGHAVYVQKPVEFCAALMECLPDFPARVPEPENHEETQDAPDS